MAAGRGEPFLLLGLARPPAADRSPPPATPTWSLSQQLWVSSSEQIKCASLHTGCLSCGTHRQKILWMLHLSMGLGAN